MRRDTGRAVAMRRKKKAPVRAHKVRSRGLWIAPDLERTIKGEGGRRGLSEPPYSYYLHLADLVLKPSTTSTAAGSRDGRVLPAPLFNPPSLHTITSVPAPVLPLPSWRTLASNTVPDMIPAPMPPIAPTLKLRKLKLPKLPKRQRHPTPPKLGSPEMPKRAERPKLSLPKPPKRGR
jgi:hypothetical protein